MERFSLLFKNIGAWVSRMTPSQVMMLLGVVAGSIVGIFLVVGWLNTATYSTLYSNLDESEAGEIVTYLSDNKIPYELSDGGRTISVPSSDVYQARISLASDGLPSKGSVGYSLFDKNNLGMTDFLQNLNFRRALEGELTRTIMQLSEVKAARVHIVMPKERLFKEDKKEATASILLKLTGKGLSKQQISGISHLVASSVEGLKPEHISIVDYNGNLLSNTQKSDAIAGLTSSQLDVRKQVENYLEEKAQSMLNDVLGTGKSVVRLTADLNFQQLEKTSEFFDPNSPSIRSEERTTSSNAVTDKAEEVSESSEEGNTETTITNYELNRTNEHLIEAVGSIDRLSLAVLVDGVYKPVDNGSGESEMVYQPRPQDELDRLAAIVKNAVGFDQERNDQIEMVNIAFDRQDFQVEQEALDVIYTRDFYTGIAKKVGYFLLIALGFFYFKKKAKKLMAALGKLMPEPGRRTATAHHSVSTGGGSAPNVEKEDFEEEIPRELEQQRPRLVDEMQETAKGKPEEIAKVIKTMMVD